MRESLHPRCGTPQWGKGRWQQVPITLNVNATRMRWTVAALACAVLSLGLLLSESRDEVARLRSKFARRPSVASHESCLESLTDALDRSERRYQEMLGEERDRITATLLPFIPEQERPLAKVDLELLKLFPDYASLGRETQSSAENGSFYGQISNETGRPKTVLVKGYYRADGTYVRSHYRSK